MKETPALPQLGNRYGLLAVVSRAPDGVSSRGWKVPMYYCVCDCGSQKEVMSDNLRWGRTLSCGCALKKKMKELFTTHGKRWSPEYAVWNMMRQRCSLPSNSHYKDYGGRGIKVCDRWQKFENFYEDIGPRPFPGATIDRENNDAGYSPENCRWATTAEQARNKRTTRRFEFRGDNLTIAEWAEKVGIGKATLANRLYSCGWGIEKALTEPVNGCPLNDIFVKKVAA